MRQHANGRKGQLLQSALLLALVQILLRGAAVSFNGYVAAKIGAESMGLFTLVMSVYGFAVTLAASGVNLAAVRLTADRAARLERLAADGKSVCVSDWQRTMNGVVRAVCGYSLLFGCGAGALLLAAARPIAKQLLADDRTLSSLRLLAYSLPAISLTTALAGYFTGIRKVAKNALLAALEQAMKILVTTTALVVTAAGEKEPAVVVEKMCLAVVGGSAASEAWSLVTALLLYWRDTKRPPGARAETTKIRTLPDRWLRTGLCDVASIALPTAVGAYARQGLVTAEHLAIPWGLRKSGQSPESALSEYGILQGMVLPVILFPYAVLGAFTGVLLPEVTAMDAAGDEAGLCRISRRVLRCAAVFSAVGLLVFGLGGRALGLGLYHNAAAGSYIRQLAPLVPLMYMDTVIDTLLKGMGEQIYCMKVNIADAFCSLLFVAGLTPVLGLGGYIFSLYACEAMNLTCSALRLAGRLRTLRRKSAYSDMQASGAAVWKIAKK